MTRTVVSGSLLLFLLAGCGTTLQSDLPSTGTKPASDGDVEDQSQPAWETQEYVDTYLAYEIPADW